MDELESLGRAVRRLRGGAGRRYSASLKRRIVAAVEKGHSAGWSWSSMSEVLGVPVLTFQRWRAERVDDPPLKPVAVVPETVLRPTTPVVIMPSGLRVEGLDVDDVVAILRALS